MQTNTNIAAATGFGRYCYRTGKNLPQTLVEARKNGANVEAAQRGWVAERSEMAA